MSKKVRTEKVFQIPEISLQDEVWDSTEGTLNSSQEYDEEGNLLLETSYHPDGSISDKNEYHYDGKGRLSRSVIFSEEDEPLETREIHRDEKGNPVKEEITYMDGSVDTVSYSYSNGMLKEKKQVTDEGELELKEIYDYSGDKLTLYEKYDAEGRVLYRLENVYKDSSIQETRVWSSEDEAPFSQVIEYDAGGQSKLELRYDNKDRLIERNIYERDGQGNVSRVIEENPSRKNTTGFSYDDQGRLVHQLVEDMNGQVVTEIHRSYDDEGRLSRSHVRYMDRMLGALRENGFIYEYDYYD